MADAEPQPYDGQCLCGTVKFVARLTPEGMHACHCDYCRKWSGGVFLGLEARSISFDLDQIEAVGVYQSSDWAERVFCRECGTNLAWRMQDGTHKAVSLAALNAPPDVSLTTELFIDKKPGGYAFANDTKKLTGAELIALMTGG